MRKVFKIPQKLGGVLVTSTHGKTKRFDILTHVAGKPINNEGAMLVTDIIELAMRESVIDVVTVGGLESDDVLPFENLISLYLDSEPVELTVYRDGKTVHVTEFARARIFNVPRLEYQDKPRYYGLMGMVFVPLSGMLINQLKMKGAYTGSLQEFSGIKIPSGDEYIVLTDIFVTEFTEGFPNDNFILDSVNGIQIKNLKHLESVVEKEVSPKGADHLLFTFKDTNQIAALSVRDIKNNNKKIIIS